jgi:hypothetical protein
MMKWVLNKSFDRRKRFYLIIKKSFCDSNLKIMHDDNDVLKSCVS